MELAKESFMNLLAGLASDEQRRQFVEWIQQTVIEELPQDFGCTESVVDGRNRLRIIAEFARHHIPDKEAIMKSEQIFQPASENGVTVRKVCLSLDSFLFDEEDEEKMVAEGIISRNFCRDCGSKNTSEIEFITHSCSRERLEFVFRALLPSLSGKTVLDVGSRFGAVLYGAYFFSDCPRIIGLEMNSELCQIQRKIIEQFSLSNRISVVEAEMTSRPDVMSSADVIVLNNVWDWFLPQTEDKLSMWRFVKENAKSGALIVTVPDLKTSFEDLGISTSPWLSQWVRELNPTYPERVSPSIFEEESSDCKLYQVI